MPPGSPELGVGATSVRREGFRGEHCTVVAPILGRSRRACDSARRKDTVPTCYTLRGPPPPLAPAPSMSGNTLGTLFRVTSFGESHGPAIGCVVDGCPPGMALAAADIQRELDRRKPGTSRHVTQRREPDAVEILSGVFEGRTTGTPIALVIRNEDARGKDYAAIAETF